MPTKKTIKNGHCGACVCMFVWPVTVIDYTGWPRNNGTVDTVDFQDFALIK